VLSKADNELLCRVGPGTAMGEVFRRFWHPVCLTPEPFTEAFDKAIATSTKVAKYANLKF
jgi:hypothetical protein